MGTVYKAIDPRLDRTVALKTVRLDPSSAEYPEFRERFHAEAKSAGRLSHPNIVTIHDFGEVDNVAFIAMEYLRGETLRDMLDRQRFSVRRAVRYAMQIADGLAAAHADGVVHRDIKPANVLRLPNGLLKITDFGIAQVPTSQVTQAGTVLGTPKYMSPEQMRGMRVDRRSDIFSLGVVLYEMLTGTLPFGGASLSSVAYQIVHDQPIHPSRWNPAIPEALVRILAKCLEKDPDGRYQGVDDVARDLRQYKNHPVAADADVGAVFLPLDPAAQALQSTPISKPVDGATQAWLSATLPLDQTQPLEPVEAAPSGMPEGRRTFLPVSPPIVTALLVGAGVLFSLGLYTVWHSSRAPAATALSQPQAPVAIVPDAAPALATQTANNTAVANNSSASLAPVEIVDSPVAPVLATDETDAPASDKKPATSKVVKKAKPPQPTGEVSPVVLSEPAVEILPAAPLQAPGPSPAELAARKRLQDEAAFKLSLKKERDCLVSNRCE
jgi:serine/threonine-protein kinase